MHIQIYVRKELIKTIVINLRWFNYMQVSVVVANIIIIVMYYSEIIKYLE